MSDGPVNSPRDHGHHGVQYWELHLTAGHPCWDHVQQHLKEHHAEGVDLAALRHLASPHVDRARVARSSARELAIHGRARPRLRSDAESEVRHLRAARAQEDIGGLYVAVERAGCCVVQVRQARGRVARHREPLVPEERHAAVLGLLEAPADVTPREELIEEEATSALLCPPHEHDKVWMPELAEDHDLVLEASYEQVVTKRGQIDHLHRSVGAVRQFGPEYGASAALAKPA
mmetsp:Transcript_45806/g.127508  ORF Transcript_45806/g.127508 Transcript_45806/m.127508 type:complete len:232 (-) Transcript_45806:187-882(-)